MGVRSAVTQIRFTAGQLSAKLKGLFDLPAYFNGAEKLLNFIPYLQGPARFREGTRYVRTTDTYATLVPFIFSDEQSYMLEFTHRRMRVFKDGALLMHSTGIGPITDIAASGLDYTNYELVGHGLPDYAEVMLEGIVSPDHNGGPYTIRVVDADNFKIARKFNGSFTASPSSKVYQIAGCVTPYRAWDDGIPNTTSPGGVGETFLEKGTVDPDWTVFTYPEFLSMQYVQANDVMYTVHETCEPRKITRPANELSWTCSTYTRTADPFSSSKWPKAITFFEQRLVYGNIIDTPQAIRGSDSGAFETHTSGTSAANAISYAAASRLLNAVQVVFGTEDYLFIGASEGTMKMSGGGSNDALTPTNVLVRDIDSEGVAPVMPALIDKTPVFVRKDRKKLLTLRVNPNTGKYEADDLTKLNDEILRGRVRKMAYQRGTPNVLWCVLDDGSLVGVNIDSKENIVGFHQQKTRDLDSFKDVAVIPVSNGQDQVWFIVEREINGETVNYIETMDLPTEYVRRQDYYSGSESTREVLDTEEFRADLYHQQRAALHMDSALSYDGYDQDVTVTPSANTVGTGRTFTASAAVFASTDVDREIWEKNGVGRAVITGYTSSTVVTCEIIRDFRSTEAMAAGDWCLTAGSVTGLTHLAGTEVTILADGSLHELKVVSSAGEITLDRQCGFVLVGLPYIGIIKTMPVAEGPGRLKTLENLVVKFLDSLGAKYGTNPYKLKEMEWSQSGAEFDRPPPLFTGDKKLPPFDSAAKEKSIYIVQDRPYPCTVSMIATSIDTDSF